MKILKRKIAMITHMPFWLDGLGCHTVAKNRYRLLTSMFEEVHVIFMNGNSVHNMPYTGVVVKYQEYNQELVERVSNFINSEGYDTLYCHYDFFTEIAANVKAKKIIEIHDVIHLRKIAFENYGYTAPIQTNKETELINLSVYDEIISLNINESNYLKNCGLKNVTTIAPNFLIEDKFTTQGNSIGMIGSQAKPNIDGYNYYKSSFKEIESLIIAGSICEKIKNFEQGNIKTVGFIADLDDYYSQLYGALVPVRFGGGLKIKTIEAIIHRVPVLSTSHGTEGMPPGIEEISLIFDRKEDWKASNFLALKGIKRENIAQYINDNLSDSSSKKKILEVFK